MAVVVRVVVKEGGTPLDDVDVRVYTSQGAFLAVGRTGAGAEVPGEASFALDGAVSPGTDYVVRLFKAGYAFTPAPTQKLQVIEPEPTGGNVFDVAASKPALKQSIDQDMCMLSGRLVDLSLRPLPKVLLRFQPLPEFYEQLPTTPASASSFPAVVRDRVLVGEVVVTTAKDGYLEVELPRLGIFDVLVDGLDHPFRSTERIHVPDQAGFAFEEVFFPYVKTVAYAPNPATVAADAQVDVGMTVTVSDERKLTSASDIVALLQFESSDAAVAHMAVLDQALRVGGLKAGSATITAKRRKGTFSERRPVLPALGGLVVTVT